MSTETLNILLIEDDPDYAELVTNWLVPATEEEPFRLSWTDSLAPGLDRLGAGDIDVVLLDLGLPDSDGLPTFKAIRECAPGTPVIILSAADNESLALGMIQDGAENYLVKSSCTADLLLRAVRYAVVRHRAQLNKLSAASTGHRVFGIIGAAGGVGATTFACNFAQELHRQTGENVLLADLDVQAGSVSFHMGIEPKYSLLDAIANIDHLDFSCLETIVDQKGKDLPVLASPALLGAAGTDTGSVQRLVDLSRSLYRWVVLDLGPVSCFSRSVLNGADELFVVTTPGLPALYETKRMIDGFVEAGLSRDRIRLIVNQGEGSYSLSAGEFKQMFGIQVQARLPNASEDLRQAYVERRLPGENTKLRKEVARLAREVAGLPELPQKRSFSRLLTFGERSCKVEKNRSPVATP